MPVHQRDDEEIHGVTSEAQPRAREDQDAPPSSAPDPQPIAEAAAVASADGFAAQPVLPDPAADEEPQGGRRAGLPLVPLLSVLLVLLLAAGGWLWTTRPDPSSVTTADYVEVLQAARSGVVDMTSFDHLTLDDDIAEIRRVATGDLLEESVAQLEGQRDQFVQVEAVVNTEVIGAGVTRADGSSGTVLLVIQSTQRTVADPRPQIVKYRIQVELQKVDDRWLLSGISGL